MKKLLVTLVILLILITVGCSKKQKRDPEKDPQTVDTFISEMKETERPAADAFDAFLLTLDTIMTSDSLSKERATHLIQVMQSNRDILTAASKQFLSQSMSTSTLPVDDTLSKLMKLSAHMMARSYEARSAAVANFILFFTQQNPEILKGYEYSLNQSKIFTTKAIFWMNMSRQYASGMESPKLPENMRVPEEEAKKEAAQQTSPAPTPPQEKK